MFTAHGRTSPRGRREGAEEGEEGADVEQGGQGDDERKEELSDPFCRLDEPEYSANPEHPDHPEQGGGDGEVGHEVLHKDSHDGGDDKDATFLVDKNIFLIFGFGRLGLLLR